MYWFWSKVLPTLAFSTTLILAGCGGTIPTMPSQNTAPPPISRAAIDDIKQLLEQAHNSPSPEKERNYLRAADRLAAQGETDWAKNLLSSMDTATLSDNEFIHYSLLFSGIAMQDGAYFLSQRILTNQRIEQQWSIMPPDTAVTLRQRRAQLFGLLGESVASIRERLVLSNLLQAGEYENQNQDAIWQTLMTLPLHQLQYLSRSERDPLLKGWYALAALSKNNQTDLERQLARVDDWVARWPEHPASIRLPSDLQLLKQLVNERPQNVAMLLPSNGKWARAGKAIRDGFFAAYYQAYQQQNQLPQIQIYDTSAGDINSTYDHAVAQGAEMIIGPLDKDKVTALNQRESLPVPTLALNNIEATIPAAGLYQFGLAVEDEARQAARRAWLEGHRKAMILTSNTAHGERGALAFREEWENLGGKVVGDNRFSPKGGFSKVIKSGLHVEQSNDRAKHLRQSIGKNIEFEPRRRQDVDMVFLIASPTEARQIKPTMAFHYAGGIPVYATSHVYSGVEDRKGDRDLKGIKFSTLPWVFDTNSVEKQAVMSYAKPPAAYTNLYAMGVDTYRLYPRLKQLGLVPDARFYGATGALRLLPNRKVEREQMWAQIRGGKAKPLPAVVSGNYVE